MIPLHELPIQHSACDYLRQRGFDPALLGRRLQVGYCQRAEPCFGPAQGRLIIPVHRRGQLVGWQARYLGDGYQLKGVHKYHSMPGMPRAELLYNHDQALAYPYVVVCEGPTDVWRVGPAAVALFGKTMSSRQRQLLAAGWGKGVAIILLDGEASAEACRIDRELLGWVSRRVLVPLPDGGDPGGLPHGELWARIDLAAKRQNIDLRSLGRAAQPQGVRIEARPVPGHRLLEPTTEVRAVPERADRLDITLGGQACPFTHWRPENGRVFERFSFDVATTDLDAGRPDGGPAPIVGAACDGARGVFVSREDLKAFFEVHPGAEIIMHHAAFGLKVLAPLLQPGLDLYGLVEASRVWDTMILHRLLSLATAGHTARAESSLADCVRTFLGLTLETRKADTGGQQSRTNSDCLLGKPSAEIAASYLMQLGCNVLATWQLYSELRRRIDDVLQNAHGVWGYVHDAPDRMGGAPGSKWLRYVLERFGPLTHHIQLRASILMDVLSSNGIGIDQARREEKEAQVRATLEECKGRLGARGYRVGAEGSDQELQEILTRFHRDHPDSPLKRTESGERWSTAEEDLAELAEHDSLFGDYARYRHAEKLLSTYLSKMGLARIHPRFEFLLETGRTSCSDFTLQNLPGEKDLLEADKGAVTVRGCCVPGDGCIFIDSDYGQLELVLLAYAWAQQFGFTPHLAPIINADNDVHRLISATVQGKDPKDVTKNERNSAKPVSFGRPGGMGVRGLRKVAKASYGIELTEEEVQERIQAYHRLCPELNEFLRDEVDSGFVLARRLDLTPAQYYRAIGVDHDPLDAKNTAPAGWLGGMLLKVLRDKEPTTNQGSGRPYSPGEIAFFWAKAQHLPLSLPPRLQDKLHKRQPDVELWQEVRDWAGRRPVVTVTGRLRANATFCSSRNTIFQGAAADGAILALWLVWRAGYKIVNFVHDQLVVESPADDAVQERAADIKRLMKQGMALVAPGMLVKVETVVTRSLNKEDLDPRYDPKTKAWSDASNSVVETGKPAATHAGVQ